jgi:CheY-like chemotaxis protein
MERVLVIDDELEHAEIVATLLRREGYEVEIAHDAPDGLLRAASAPPDLILLDLYMPLVDGFDAADRLRADPRTREVPVILLSACGEQAAAERGVELGAAEYPRFLPKPFHAVDLIEMASLALGKK